MAVLRIAKMGNPILRTPAAPVVDPMAPEIAKLAADMRETLEDIGASGLAANQVGKSINLLIVDTNNIKDNDEEGKSYVFINSKVINP